MIEIIATLLLLSCVSFYMGVLVGRSFAHSILVKTGERLVKEGMTPDEVVSLFNRIAQDFKDDNNKK